MSNATGALAMMVPLIFLSSLPFGGAVSSLQQLTPNEMRGQVSALYLFVNNLIGFGAGPAVIALISDHWFQGEADLRHSMSIVAGASAILAVAVLRVGSRHFCTSVEKLAAWNLAISVRN
jgi:hypothetical protein